MSIVHHVSLTPLQLVFEVSVMALWDGVVRVYQPPVAVVGVDHITGVVYISARPAHRMAPARL